ncbi:MAG: hypothetical protein J0H74_19185 [Chitinophagaceae bacterium]|nr:hypothetical protein [Chitinophagaceae bacterium]
MKRIIISSLGIFLLFGLVFSCKKNDINGDSKTLVGGSYITLDSTINSFLDISTSTASVSIKVKNTVGEKVASIDVYAATGTPLDTSKWVKIKTVAYADGVVLNVTTAELATAFGATPLSPGKSYTLQNQITTASGRKFSVNNTPSNYNSFPAYNMALTWQATAVCPFVQADAIGDYKVVSDKNWQDFSVGDIITVSAGPDQNSLSFLAYPSPAAGGANRQPWIVNVDPAKDVATMKDQYVGDYPGPVHANSNATGFVFSCTGLITLKVNVNYGGTIYANQEFILQKK